MLQHADQQITELNLGRISAEVDHLVGTLDQTVTEANVPALSDDAQKLMVELRATNKYLKDLLAPPEWVAGRPNVPEIVARLNQTIAQLNSMIATERPQINTMLSEFQQVADSLNELVSALREQPSSLLFGRPPRKSEVLK